MLWWLNLLKLRVENDKKIFKIIAIIFGFIIVLFIGITYFVLNELFDGLCGDYIFKEYSSPNKTK